MISGAAKDSEPHRVCRAGSARLMNRDKPKSVSLTRGVGSESSGMLLVDVGGSRNGLTARSMSSRRVSHARMVSGHGVSLTLQLDVPMHHSDLVQPSDTFGQLAVNPPYEAFPDGILRSWQQHPPPVLIVRY